MRSLSEIHEAIDSLEQDLEALTTEIDVAARDAAQQEATFKARFSQARLTTRSEATGKITVDEVEDHATMATSEARFTFLVAQNRLLSAREALKARISQMDGLRSQAASYRGAGG